MMAYKDVRQELALESEAMVLRSNPKIGINKLVVEAPQTYFSYVEIANALNARKQNAKRQMDPEKIRVGLGIEKMRLPTYSQGNVTMAANALYSFIKNVDSDFESREKFFTEKPTSIYFATESNPDFSRPEVEVALGLVYSKLLEENEKRYRPYVEVLKNCGIQQNTFACAGAGLALSSAVGEIYTGNSVGMKNSAIIISADTAVYENSRAPGAEATQGSSSTLMWITTDPNLVSVNYQMGYGRFNMPFPDFTKFGYDTPFVHGKFSEKGYVYAVAMAMVDLESKMESTLLEQGFGMEEALRASYAEYYKSMKFFVSHVPFPKQAIYFASFLFEHYLKSENPKLFAELQKRGALGASPLGEKGMVELLTKKFVEFKGRRDIDIVSYIENDAEINAYWEWLGKLRKQPEFDLFVEKLQIKRALEIPSQVGNSYTGSTIVAMASLLKNGDYKTGDRGICVFFGSGMVAMAYPLEIRASQSASGKDLIISLDNKPDIQMGMRDYEGLHRALAKGDAKRSMRSSNSRNLVEKDMKLLRGKLPEGFLIRRRNSNGTWEAEYVENGKRQTLRPRF
ncbi:hypothetical protein M1583_00600 [Candidatus Marsarchaeota archaeon]|nr:hypothetical protein [Candidatus Marsarchaeota archaeon]